LPGVGLGDLWCAGYLRPGAVQRTHDGSHDDVDGGAAAARARCPGDVGAAHAGRPARWQPGASRVAVGGCPLAAAESAGSSTGSGRLLRRQPDRVLLLAVVRSVAADTHRSRPDACALLAGRVSVRVGADRRRSGPAPAAVPDAADVV